MKAKQNTSERGQHVRILSYKFIHSHTNWHLDDAVAAQPTNRPRAVTSQNGFLTIWCSCRLKAHYTPNLLPHLDDLMICAVQHFGPGIGAANFNGLTRFGPSRDASDNGSHPCLDPFH